MNCVDIILSAILITCAVFVVARIIRRRKKGGGFCGCSGCEGCAMRETCTQEKKK